MSSHYLDMTMMFFRNTVQMQMLTNTYIHSSLWMYARTPYPYEHLRKSEPMGLDLDGRWERSLPLKEYSKFMRHQSVESQVFPPNHPTTGGRCGRDEPRQEEVHWLKLQLTEPADELCWSKPHKGDERVTGDGGRDNGQEVVHDALVHALEAHAAIFFETLRLMLLVTSTVVIMVPPTPPPSARRAQLGGLGVWALCLPLS